MPEGTSFQGSEEIVVDNGAPLSIVVVVSSPVMGGESFVSSELLPSGAGCCTTFQKLMSCWRSPTPGESARRMSRFRYRELEKHWLDWNGRRTYHFARIARATGRDDVGLCVITAF